MKSIDTLLRQHPNLKGGVNFLLENVDEEVRAQWNEFCTRDSEVNRWTDDQETNSWRAHEISKYVTTRKS